VNEENCELKLEIYDMKSSRLLIVVILACLPSCKTPSPTTKETVRLYSLPPVLKVLKGTEIVTADGIVVVPADTLLHGHGSFMEQVERGNRP